MKLAKKISLSHTYTGTSSSTFKVSRAKLASLLELLPSGSQRFFEIVPAGNNLGLRIKCPHCDYTPPKTLSGYRKWRNLAAHIAQHKPRIIK